MRIKTFLSMIIMLIISSCSPTRLSPIGACIDPLNVDVSVKSTMPSDYQTKSIPPSGNWQYVIDLPQEPVTDIAITPDGDIWVAGETKVIRFTPGLNELKEYNSIGYVKSAVPTVFFVAKDGTLWGTDIFFWRSDDMFIGLPVLSRYNKVTDQFEFVTDNQEILRDQEPFQRLFMIKEDNAGVLWGVAQIDDHDSLISFNPQTMDAEIYSTDLPNSLISSLAIGPDGSVWLSDYFGGQLIKYNRDSRQFSIEFRKLQFASIFEFDMKGLRNLYFDNQGRLWIEDRGWFDLSQDQIKWHNIKRSRVFITDNATAEIQYAWLRPYETYQSSDGMFWFSALTGMVHYDPDTSEWCLFTTDQGQIVEDGQHTMWMATFGKLYKLPLQP